jgi:hypothetical protein
MLNLRKCDGLRPTELHAPKGKIKNGNVLFYFRYSILLASLWAGPSCFAQEVTIHVINANDGHPLQNQEVKVNFLYDKGDKLPAKYDATLRDETDADGKAQFAFPEPAPAHTSVRILIDWGRWRCGCRVLANTQDILEKGIVESIPDRRKLASSIKAKSGEIVVVARPLSLFWRVLFLFEKS